jgi:FKBP-type peptidyl-prolyl cis-trans isomerase FklB
VVFFGISCATSNGDAPPAAQSDAGSDYEAGYALGRALADRASEGESVEITRAVRGLQDGFDGRPIEAARVATAESRRAAPRRGPFVDDFAALNAQRDGVTTLPSGVQYESLASGDGPQPDPSDTVEVRYVGSLADGRVFDSTDGAGGPTRLRIEDISVPGLREALLLMRVGDRWRVVIPPSMGFGRSGNNMLRRRDLIYDIELVAIGSGA